MSMPTATPFKRDDIVYRPDHVFSGEIDPMRVLRSGPHFTDCVYTSGVHVSQPTHRLALEPAYEEYLAGLEEGPTCHSCDGLLTANAITCPCGAVIDEEKFWTDPCEGMTFEERMEFECALEQEERRGF